MYQLYQCQLLALMYTHMSLNWYFSLVITGFPLYDIIGEIPSLTVMSFGTDTNACLFVYLSCRYSETFSFLIHASIFLLVGQPFFNHLKTIIDNPL